MKRRLLPMMMTLVLVCALPIWAAFVTSGDVTNPLVSTAWATLPDLQAKIDAAADNATITLDSNTEIAATLQITKNLTLDLNGCVLRMTGNTSVFYVYNNATLTIQDSSAAKSGTITGGNAGDGGGVYIGGNSSEGHLVMTGGTITGCATDPSRGGGRGGGVFVFKGSFTMSGTAKITNCTADWGGGVVVHTRSSTFTMNGGEISDCKASNTGGGVCLIGGAWFEMTGGTIRNCTDGSVESSAIYMDPGTMKAHGGTVKGNVCVSEVGNCVITHEPSQEGYTIFDGTIYVEQGTSLDAQYPITYDLDGGTGPKNTPVTLNSPLPQPQPPVRPGYEFTGWTVTVTGTEPQTVVSGFEFGSTPVTKPLTLTAKWEEVPSSGGYYYYTPPAEQPIEAPKTADPGVALYAALSLLSLTGLTCITKKR
jgi:uncharacterized repeat protein (TIGR02543 family)